MFKRTLSLLFVFLLAGQVWAGVCGCLGGTGSEMKCCKRSTEQAKIGAKRCCGDICAEKSHTQAPRSQSENHQTSVGVVQSASTTFSLPDFVLAKDGSRRNDLKSTERAPALLARPPDLFLKHHSFRI